MLGYEGLGSLLGGALLVAGPDGRFMDMPVGLMHGTFADFLIPGTILLGLGLLNVAAFFAILRRRPRIGCGRASRSAGWQSGSSSESSSCESFTGSTRVGPPRHPGPDGGGPVAPLHADVTGNMPAIGVNIA